MNKFLLSTFVIAAGGVSTLSPTTAEACDTCGCRDAPQEVTAEGSEQTPEQRHSAHFAEVDADESGAVSFGEFTTAMSERHAARADAETCEHAGGEECDCGDGNGGWRADGDTDGDGEVSEEERDAHFLVRFAELDSDESGEVSQDEMRAAHQGEGHGHGGRGQGDRHGQGDGAGHGDHGHGDGHGHDH